MLALVSIRPSIWIAANPESGLRPDVDQPSGGRSSAGAAPGAPAAPLGGRGRRGPWRRYWADAGPPARHAVCGEREDQAVRIFLRERAQQDGVGHAEDGGAGADAEGDGQNGGGRKDGALAQPAECVREVTKQHAFLLEFVSG